MANRNPWDKLPDESDEAYKRFLIYLNLDAYRSLDAAYRVAHPLEPVAANSRKTRGKKQDPKTSQKRLVRAVDNRRASGQWVDDCAQHNWKERALAWDIAKLTRGAERIVAKFITLVESATDRQFEALTDPKFKPRKWMEFIETLSVLASFVPRETLAELRYSRNAPSSSANDGSAGTGGSGANPAERDLPAGP